MTNIILCGGSGTRLWPVSRTLMPKQFVKFFNDLSLFQLTCRRNGKICDEQLIISSAELYFLALDQLDGLNTSINGTHNSKFLLETIARNTAPAIALACMALDEDEVVLVTPSDHLIKDERNYFEAVNRATELAQEGYLVTFGITPTYPETGFGYIEAHGEDVNAFYEKPSFEIAQQYISAGNYFWNSGMFCFKTKHFLNELKYYSPEIFKACKQAYACAVKDALTIRIKYDDMAKIPEDSVDYAVMEKSDKIKVIECDFGWSDVGSFDALYEEFPKDINGNTLCQKHVNINSNNNLIMASTRKISTIDIDDLIIVDTPDALLISKKGSSQKVKNVVAELKKRNTDIHNIHLTVHRPWGTYTVLEDTAGYKIKRIVVAPGKKLSLQKHLHRSEHWVVVSGVATVTVGTETLMVKPNESTYIKRGELHRLANDGDIPIILIEAQVGEYTGEDDIIRIEDEYDRS
ncbi:MAG: mannose-1-phosphate guanylyltransferase/mannose-6-phosphate isomerase [Sulfurospirillaceae bacterium]|nr:mannose-1-phosphate guanylyltransferase/mannose-6-phosphate isomerase [Sulfurospirillaceae bacterium]